MSLLRLIAYTFLLRCGTAEMAPCADQHDYCDSVAASGGCESNPKFMHKECAFSCGVCRISGTPNLERMPIIGWGTCCRPTAQGEPLKTSLRDFLRLGGRLIDTAIMYGNHREIGEVLKEQEFAWLPREELFITSKIPPGHGDGSAEVAAAVSTMLEDLQTPYVDLLLLHAPGRRHWRTAAWRGLERVLAQEKVKAIGVSNFEPQHFMELVEDGATITPMNNQISLHPGELQEKTVRYCREHGISITAFNSVKGQRSLPGGQPLLRAVAAKHGMTPVQVLLRWGVDSGVSVIPGCTSREHIKQALDVAKFGPLGATELQALSQNFQKGRAECWTDGVSYDACCDDAHGREGNALCWDGYFNFQRCCARADSPLECTDHEDTCSILANLGECERSPGFMHRKCGKSCGICTMPGTPGLERMPIMGWGTCCRHTAQGEPLKASMRDFLRLGGRLIDTAIAYENHLDIGQVLKEPQFDWLSREELFITSKVPPQEYGEHATEAAVSRVLGELQTTYLDLVLLHAPSGRRSNIVAWRALEKVLAQGKVKAIGVSNFAPQHFEELVADGAQVTPMNNQISLHPGETQDDTVAYCHKHGISITAFNSVKGRNAVPGGQEVLNKIAAKHGKTPVQVLLRWGVDKGISMIPGCTSREHLKEALDVVRFGPIEQEDMSALMQGRGNAECWIEGYNYDLCCDLAQGPTGNAQCWSGPFNYQTCCF